LNTLTLEEYKRDFTLPYMDFYNKFDENLKSVDVDKVFYEEISFMPKSQPFSAAKEILEYIKNKGKNLAILSSHPQ
jgi:FMN phosphatase YigB (HAD superfamily)